MDCPNCGTRLDCLETRKGVAGMVRRYECKRGCGMRHITEEKVVDSAYNLKHAPAYMQGGVHKPDNNFTPLTAANDAIAARLRAVLKTGTITDAFKNDIETWLKLAQLSTRNDQ